MWFVYVIQGEKDKSFYVGATQNIKKRLQEHNWHLTTSNKNKAPYKLAWYCGFEDKLKALKFERYLKSGSGFAFRNKHLI